MFRNLLKSWLILTILLVLAACGSTGTQSPAAPQAAPTEKMMEKPTDAMAKPTDAAMPKPTDAMAKPTDAAMQKPTDAAMQKPTEAVMQKPTEAAMQKPTEAAMEKPTEAAMEKPTEAAMEKPTEGAMSEHAMAAWQKIELTDARTGKTFTLADFAGKTIYVEPMATWCPNCRAQLGNVQQAKTQLGSDDFVFVALSVETDLDKAKLAEYADTNGFEATFAVASPEMLQALVDSFGRSAINPPSTPHFIVSPDGSISELMTGTSDATSIVEMMKKAMKAM